MADGGSVKVALVTGAARGLGRAIAQRLSMDGLVVVLGDVDEAAAVAAVTEMTERGAAATAAWLDVTDSASVDAVVERALDVHGRIDVLVSNAGVVRDRPLVRMTDDDFRTVVDVSLFGAFRCARAVAPGMIDRRHGRIVNVSSRAYLGNPGQANYSAAKAGLVGLTRALAKELGAHRITVNAVAPGVIATDMVRAHPRYDRIAEHAVRENSIPRLGEPEDVASAVAYLCSDEASFVTGEVLHVSGGRYG